MSKLVSTRLEDELAVWVDSYRESRGWSRAELIDAALRSYREGCLSGVPELPRASVPEREPSGPTHAQIMGARMVALNRGKYGRDL